MLRYLTLTAGTLLFILSCAPSRPSVHYTTPIDNGYQTINARNSTGGVAQIDHPAATVTLADQLQAVAGVNVTGQGPNARVRIHGGASFTHSEPLFIIDGQPFNSFAQVYAAVNVVDIRSISVLRDNAQAAIYGGRAANGVIVIRTKNGS